MPWAIAAAAIGVGGSLLAAGEQSSAANKANQTEWNIFKATEANEQPFINAGTAALAPLEQGLGIGPGAGTPGYGSLTQSYTPDMYKQSPDYQFNLNAGNSNILNNATATGGVNSSNTLRSLQQFGVGLANQDYQQARSNYVGDQQQKFGMLETVAGSGQNAAANLGSIGSQTAASIGNNIIGAGNANAAGIVGATNSVTGGVNNYLQYQFLNSIMNGSNPGNTNPASSWWGA